MRIATVGDNCLDVYQDSGTVCFGGNSVNVSVYLKRLGAQASYVGAVGTDAYGQEMCNALAGREVDISHVHRLPGRTAVTQVTVGPDGERQLGDYDEGVLASLKLTADDMDFLCSHELVHTGLWGKVEDRLKEIRFRGAPVSFDFATDYTGPVFDTALPHTDYAFFSARQDTQELRDFLKMVCMRGPRLAVATLGAAGSLAFDGARYDTYAALPVQVVDTLGAGDSYIAGFLQGMIRGLDVQACMAQGAECARYTLQYTGAW